MECMEKTRRNWRIYLLYTLVYIAAAALVFCWFYMAGRSLVYHSDGWRQHIKALTYYGKWLRGTARHLLGGGKGVQTWTFGLGYGADVLTTLQYYCFGDPLTFPVMFVPTSCVIWFYEFLVLFRPWLSGAFFIAYCRYRSGRVQGNEGALLTGALIYAFSGTTMYIGLLHPYFLVPMVWLPLMLLGAEKFIRENKPVLFVLAVFAAALSNFYFFYMLAVFTAGYCVLRLIGVCGVKNGILRGLRLFLYAALGTAMAGAVLVPVLVQFANDPRAKAGYSTPLFYSAQYYRQLFRNAVSFINHPLYDTELCFPVTALAALAILLAAKGHRYLKAVLGILTLMVLMPYAGRAMNGFAYVINRWGWAFAMLAGYIAFKVYSEGTETETEGGRQFGVRALVSGALLALFTFFSWRFGQTDYPGMTASLILLWAAFAAGLVLLYLKRTGSRRAMLMQWCTTLLTVVSVAVNAWYGYSEGQGNFPSEFMERMGKDNYEEVLRSTEESAVLAAAQSTAAASSQEGAESEQFYRYTGRNLTWNAAMMDGVSSTQFAFSFANGAVSDYFMAVGNNDEQNFAYFSLDDRMMLLALAGVKYYSLTYDNWFEYQFIPYGYKDLGMVGNYHLYENLIPLPLGYGYESYITDETFRDLTTTERQEAMLQGVVTDAAAAERIAAEYAVTELSADASQGGAGKLVFSEELPAFTVAPGEGAALIGTDGGDGSCTGFSVTQPGAEVRVSFAGKQDCETYIAFDNLQIEGADEIYSIVFAAYSGGKKTTDKTLSYKTPKSQYYSGWKDFAVNLCYSGQSVEEIVITFPQTGTYTFDKMRVVCQGTESYVNGVQKLQAAGMYGADLHENPVSYATNLITAHYSTPKDVLLGLSIPWSKGWSAEVDGEPAELVKANVMYMALPVSAGDHEITLRYSTPGGRAGLALSAAGILIFILTVLYQKKKLRPVRAQETAQTAK